MKTNWILATAVLASAAFATSGLAQVAVQTTVVVQPTVVTEVTTDLNRFVGSNLFGFAHANLGTVSQVDPAMGVVALSGRYGEFALISANMLVHNGLTLYAPTLTAGDIKLASEMNLAHPGAVLTGPQVIIMEPAEG